MPPRSVKIYGAILGFHRRVRCPKCTPDSRSCFIDAAGIYVLPVGCNDCTLPESHRTAPLGTTMGSVREYDDRTPAVYHRSNQVHAVSIRPADRVPGHS